MSRDRDIWDVLIDGSIIASGHILRGKGLSSQDIDVDALTEALKVELKSAIPGLMSEWENALEGRLSEGWLRQMVNAQATEIASRALAQIGV